MAFTCVVSHTRIDGCLQHTHTHTHACRRIQRDFIADNIIRRYLGLLAVLLSSWMRTEFTAAQMLMPWHQLRWLDFVQFLPSIFQTTITWHQWKFLVWLLIACIKSHPRLTLTKRPTQQCSAEQFALLHDPNISNLHSVWVLRSKIFKISKTNNWERERESERLL